MSVEVWFPFAAVGGALAFVAWAHFSGKALDRRIEEERKKRDHPAE